MMFIPSVSREASGGGGRNEDEARTDEDVMKMIEGSDSSNFTSRHIAPIRWSFKRGNNSNVSNSRVNVSNSIGVLPYHTSSYVKQLATQLQDFTVWNSARTNVSNSVKQFTLCCWKSQFLRGRDGILILLLQTVCFKQYTHYVDLSTKSLLLLLIFYYLIQFISIHALISYLIISSLISLAFRSTVSVIISSLQAPTAVDIVHNLTSHQQYQPASINGVTLA